MTLTAEEAYQKSMENLTALAELEIERISKKIKKETDNGGFKLCEGVRGEVYEPVTTYFKSKGFKVENIDTSQYSSWLDQGRYYDTRLFYLKWGKKDNNQICIGEAIISFETEEMKTNKGWFHRLIYGD